MVRPHRSSAFACVLSVASFTTSSIGFAEFAVADELTAHYDESSVVERSHTIAATLYPGYAELVVRREVLNRGDRPDEAIFRIDVPSGAAAVGLRTRGHGASPTWYDGKLLDSELAAAQYLELTGKGTALLRDPALLYWLGPESLGLQVFPCPVGVSQWVEYTLLVPTRYEDGRHVLDVATLGTDALRATWSVRPGRARDQLITGEIGLVAGAGLTVKPSVDTPTTIALVSEPTAPLVGELASVDLGSGRSLVRGNWRAAARISSVIDGARVVFLLDASRSMPPHVFSFYEKTLAATLPHFPNAEVAFVAFDRVARRITPTFTSPTKALESLKNSPHETMNGSHVDAALREAQLLFEGIPHDKRRLFVLTDSETRSSLASNSLDALILAPTALTHWSTLDGTAPMLTRDGSRLAGDAVEKTGGVEWIASSDSNTPIDELHGIYEEWARPLRYWVSRVEVGSQSLQNSEFELQEGASFEFDEMRSDRPRELILHAHLWGSPVTLRATTNTAAERRHGAWVARLGFHDFHDLTETEARHLAFFSRAVTPYTSYLALEPGVRPSTMGIERNTEGIGLSGIGSGGGGRGIGVGLGPKFDAAPWWKERLTLMRRECKAEAHAITVGVETTWSELVDITRLDVIPADPTIERCLTDALWSTKLPTEFAHAQRLALHVVL